VLRSRGTPTIVRQQTSHTRLAHRVQTTRSSVPETGTRPELGEWIVIEPTHIKMAPHRTVPEGRGPRPSRQVKADLRYGRGYLHTCGFPTCKPYLRTAPLNSGRAIPGLTVRSVSALRHRAPRDLCSDRPSSTGRPSHLFSAAATSRAGLSLRPPLDINITRLSD
jgi:hypothetical protein